MKPIILGILNITEDSFSDGGKYLSVPAAIEHARAMSDADVLDLGAAASNPGAAQISPEVEISRLEPVVAALKAAGRCISIDSFSKPVQCWALSQQVDYLNDIRGFPTPAFYAELANATAKLIVMHSVQDGPATQIDVPAETIFDRVSTFFRHRIASLTNAGISRSRLILDPGMGFFLGSRPAASLEILKRLPELKAAFGLPVLVSVSRKSFLRTLTGRDVRDAGAATLAAELFAVEQGVDYVRTHDPSALKAAVKVKAGLTGTPAMHRMP